MTDIANVMSSKVSPSGGGRFQWDDPFLLESDLMEDERLVMESETERLSSKGALTSNCTGYSATDNALRTPIRCSLR